MLAMKKMRNYGLPRINQLRRLFGGAGDGTAGVIFRGGVTSFLLASASIVLGFIIHILLSRVLGVIDYGLYSIALGWCLMLAGPATAGMDNTVLRFAPVYFENGQFYLLRRLAGFVACILVATSVVTFAILLTLTWLVPDVISFSAETGVGWMSLLIGASAFLAAFSAFFRGARMIFYSQFYQQIVRSVLLIGVLVAMHSIGRRFDVSDAIVATALAAAGAFVVLSLHLIVVFKRQASDTGGDAPMRTWLALGGVNLLITSLQQTQVQGNIVLLGALSTAEQAGLYSVAARLAAFVTFGLSALASITAPMIVSAWVRGDRPGLARIAVVNARLATLAAAVTTLALIVAGPYVLTLFGQAFAPSYPILLVLLASGLFSALTGPCANLLLMTNRQHEMLIIGLASMAVHVSLATLLIPSFGAAGGAIAVAGGILLGNAAMVWRVWSGLRIDATVLGFNAPGATARK